MRRLIYLSDATEEVDGKMLEDILLAARKNNGARGVTGLLLYHDGTFLQCLEGPANAVQEILDKIGGDPRHRGLVTLTDETVDGRLFPNWEMGYAPELNSVQRVGFVDIRKQADKKTGDLDVDQAIKQFFQSMSSLDRVA